MFLNLLLTNFINHVKSSLGDHYCVLSSTADNENFLPFQIFSHHLTWFIHIFLVYWNYKVVGNEKNLNIYLLSSAQLTIGSHAPGETVSLLCDGVAHCSSTSHLNHDWDSQLQ